MGPDARVHERTCVRLPSAALRYVDSCFMMCVSLYPSVLLIMVTARLISTLVVCDEATDWPFVSQARQTPTPPPPRVNTRPFWPPPLAAPLFFTF